MAPRKLTRSEAAERFWARARKAPGDGCWEWTGSRHRFGYGWAWFDGKSQNAHRVAWELVNGPIPKGQDVRMRCENPRCCRAEPDGAGHLYLAPRFAAMRAARRRTLHTIPAAMIAEVRRMGASGWGVRAISRRLRISPGHTSRILAGKARSG